MWIFTVIVLISFGGALGYSVECFVEAYDKCERLLPTEFPTDDKELDVACQRMLNFGRCERDAVKDCETNQTIQRLQTVLEYTEKGCSPDSDVYKAISSNLPCLKSAMKTVNDVCYDTKSNSVAEYAAPHFESLFEAGYKPHCVMFVWQTACESVTVWDECGEQAGKAALEISTKIDTDLLDCSKDLVDSLPDLTKALYLAEKIEKEVENEMKRKK